MADRAGQAEYWRQAGFYVHLGQLRRAGGDAGGRGIGSVREPCSRRSGVRRSRAWLPIWAQVRPLKLPILPHIIPFSISIRPRRCPDPIVGGEVRCVVSVDRLQCVSYLWPDFIEVYAITQAALGNVSAVEIATSPDTS